MQTQDMRSAAAAKAGSAGPLRWALDRLGLKGVRGTLFLAAGTAVLALVLVFLVGPILALLAAAAAGAGLQAGVARLSRRPEPAGRLSEQEVRRLLKSQFRRRTPRGEMSLLFAAVAATALLALGGGLLMAQGDLAATLGLGALLALLLFAIASSLGARR